MSYFRSLPARSLSLSARQVNGHKRVYEKISGNLCLNNIEISQSSNDEGWVRDAVDSLAMANKSSKIISKSDGSDLSGSRC